MSVEVIAIIAVIFLLFLLGGLVYYARRVRTEPSYYTGLINQAVRAIDKNDLPTARKRFLKVLSQMSRIQSPPPQLLPIKGQALLGIGNLERRANQIAKALKSYREAMSLIQVPPDVIELVARDYAQQKAMTAEAIDSYMFFMASIRGQNMSTHPVVVFLQEQCNIELVNNAAQLQATVSLIQRLIGVAPTLEWAYYALGVAQGRLNRPSEGIAALRQAEQLNPRRAMTPFHLAHLYLKHGQRDFAYDAFKRSLKLHDSPQPQILQQLTHILLARVRQYGLPTKREALDEASNLLHQTCNVSQQKSDVWHLLGQIELQRQQPQEARKAFEKASTLEPQTLTYQQALAEVLIKLDDTPAAIKSLRRIVSIAPQHLPSHLQLAKLLLASADAEQMTQESLTEAETHYRKVLELEPSHKEARLAVGRLLYRQERWGEAAHQLDEVPELSQEDMYKLGRSYSLARMPVKAVKIYQKYLSMYGSTLDICFYLGSAFAQMRQWSQAVNAFEQAERADSSLRGSALHIERSDIALYRGIALMFQGQFDQAQAAYQSAMDLAPKNARIPYASGMLAVHRGDSRAAWQAFSKSLSLDPNYAPAYFGRGLLSEQSRNHQEAILDYAQGLNCQNDWLPAQARLGLVQAKLGHWSLALAILQRVTQLGLVNDELIFYLGLAQAQLNQYEKALATWQALHARYPDDKILSDNLTITYYYFGEEYFEAGNYIDAIRYWKQGTQMRPELAEFRACLKEAYLRLAATELSQSNGATTAQTDKYLKGVLALEPNDKRVHYYLALAALKEGDTEQAINRLSFLARTDPQNHRIRYQLVLALLSENKSQTAEPLLKELAPVSHLYTPGLQIAQGNLALSQGHWAEAFDLYLESL